MQQREDAIASAPAAVTFVLQVPYVKALRNVRSALAQDGLRIVMEADIADQLRDAFGVALARCHVLGVTCPLVLLEAVVSDSSSVTLLPFHVVVAEQGEWTRLHLLHPAKAQQTVSAGLGVTVRSLAARIEQCFERAGAYHAFNPSV